MAIIQTAKINNRLTGYMVQTDKFKTDLVGVYIKRKLCKEEVALNTLLSRVLVRGTAKRPTTKDLNKYLESCYGMILVSDVVKYGDYQVLQMKLQFPDPKHIKDKTIFEQAIELINELIFQPLIVDGKFDEDYFLQEKQHLIDEIESRINDKMSYSLERCIEHMYEGEDYANYVYGDVIDVEEITNEALYAYYKKIVQSSQVDVSIMGDLSFESMENSIRSLAFDTSEVEAIEYDQHVTKKVKEVKERFDVKQGKLVLGYQTPFVHTHPLYEASVLAYYMLGGSPNSKLFKLLREEHSLCYYIYTKSDKFKGCMFVGAGIEEKNYELTLNLIEQSIEALKSDGVKQSVLDAAIESMVASIRSINDFPNSFINFCYTELLDKSVGQQFNMESIIEKYKLVTLADIKKVFNALTLDTIYLIYGGEQ